MSITKEQFEEMQARVELNRPKTPMLDRALKQVPQFTRLTQEEVDAIPDPHAIPLVMCGPLVIMVNPIGAPRMVHSDRWKGGDKKRPAVQRYHAWKDTMRSACAGKWDLPEVLTATFEVEMPPSWSKKKKAAMVGTPHMQKPDLDNIVKGLCDLFGKDDGYVHTFKDVKKTWAEKGRILLY